LIAGQVENLCHGHLCGDRIEADDFGFVSGSIRNDNLVFSGFV